MAEWLREAFGLDLSAKPSRKDVLNTIAGVIVWCLFGAGLVYVALHSPPT
jgi:hypothetical protein